MKELMLQTKLVKKNRLCWTLVFLWTVIVGVLVYTLLHAVRSLEAVFSIIILLTLVYTIVGELVTKTMDIFWIRSTIFVPLGSVITHFLNYVSPVLRYEPSDPYWLSSTFALYAILFVFCGVSSAIGTLITRLVTGYEALSEEPVVTTYSIKSKIEEVPALFESFLNSLNVEPTTIFRGSERHVKFYSGPNLYFLFLNSINNDIVEANFVAVRLKRETLMEPDKEGLCIFLAYFESFLNRRKEEGKLGEWSSALKPKYAETTKNRVWKDYTSPLQIREKIALRGIFTQKIVIFIKSHKKAIITFIGGILTVIIGELVINYLLKMIGF